MKKRAVLAVSALCVLSGSGGAQEPDTTRLETVVVSASKTPNDVTTLTQPVTVISGADLRARGVTRVSDALREIPGAAVVQSGSFGSVTSLFLRGGESRYTKVLIDGVPVNSSGGFFDFSHLTTDNVERIEIVRGPSSVLHGADAVSGTVHVITRKGDDRSRASLLARRGTYRSLDLAADGAVAGRFGGLSLGAGRYSTDGIHPFNNRYENGTLSLAATSGSTPSGEINVSGRYTAAEFHYPTDFVGQPVDSNAYRTQHRLTVGLDAGRNLGSITQARVLLASNDVADRTEDIGVPFGGTVPQKSVFRSRGVRQSAEGRVTFFLPVWTFSAGGLYEQEREVSSNEAGNVGEPGTETDSFSARRHTAAWYGELLGRLNVVSYTLSARIDDNSDYGRFGTYRIGANLVLLRDVRIRAALSTAFNAPAFNQLHPTLFTVGSPELRPEKIRSGEVGLTAGTNAVRLGISYFKQRFAELIQFENGPPPDFKGRYANLTAATANGYEVELYLSPLPGLRTTASYTFVRPRVSGISRAYTGPDRAGDALIRRPSHSGSVVTALSLSSGFALGAAATFVGKRPDLDFAQFPSPRVTLPSYAKFDFSGEAPVMAARVGRVALTARIENAFDRRYEDVLHFAAPGRVFLIGARANAFF